MSYSATIKLTTEQAIDASIKAEIFFDPPMEPDKSTTVAYYALLMIKALEASFAESGLKETGAVTETEDKGPIFMKPPKGGKKEIN